MGDLVEPGSRQHSAAAIVAAAQVSRSRRLLPAAESVALRLSFPVACQLSRSRGRLAASEEIRPAALSACDL